MRTNLVIFRNFLGLCSATWRVEILLLSAVSHTGAVLPNDTSNTGDMSCQSYFPHLCYLVPLEQEWHLLYRLQDYSHRPTENCLPSFTKLDSVGVACKRLRRTRGATEPASDTAC